MLYNYKGYGLGISTLVIGYDKMGAGLYYVDNDGTRLSGDYFSAGSGSPYAYSILDTEHRFDMTKDEAIELGRKAIYHATYRDAASGGINNRNLCYFNLMIDIFSLLYGTRRMDLYWCGGCYKTTRHLSTENQLTLL